MRCDAVVVGAGHNGLTCAAHLARAGLEVAVLERREQVGGAASNVELAPGIKVPALAHTVGRLSPTVLDDLGLAGHGLSLIRPEVRVLAPLPDGGAVTLWADPGRTAEELRSLSPRDADAYRVFDRGVRAVAGFLARVSAMTPPDLKEPSLRDAAGAVGLVRALRRAGGPEARRELLRALPMSAADFVSEHFVTDAVQAVIAVRGVLHAFMGPRAAGSALRLLADSAGNDGGAAGQTVFARGGPGAVADALAQAATGAGATIRCGAEVVRVLSDGGRAEGVVLASGEEVRAPVVVSGLDPKRTLLGLVDPEVLGPTTVWRAANLRLPGSVAKVNLLLGRLPRIPAAGGDTERLAGRIVVAPSLDYMERAYDEAKYGRMSSAPILEATIPTLSDTSLVPDGRHVMSVVVQHAPYHRREGSWDDERDSLGDLVVDVLEQHAPGIAALVEARQVLTPLDLERDYGLTEGHPFHGETGLDQFFAWRPFAGAARYRTPLPGLWLCGSGTHPGGGVTAMPGANAVREILSDVRVSRPSGSGPPR